MILVATIELSLPLLVLISVFAVIGAICTFFIILFLLAFVLDITWFERHPKHRQTQNEKKCPDFIEIDRYGK